MGNCSSPFFFTRQDFKWLRWSSVQKHLGCGSKSSVTLIPQAELSFKRHIHRQSLYEKQCNLQKAQNVIYATLTWILPTSSKSERRKSNNNFRQKQLQQQQQQAALRLLNWQKRRIGLTVKKSSITLLSRRVSRQDSVGFSITFCEDSNIAI